MLKQLEDKQIKLCNRSSWLEKTAGISMVFGLITVGAIIGSFPNSNCGRKYLKLSSSLFGLSVISLLISSRLYYKTEDEIESNIKSIEQVKNTKPACWGCIYSSSDKLLPCAIHPMEQREGCTDKVLRYFK